MKEQVRVTVIIPVFKAADTLDRAVQSVLAQTEKNLELIIIDDCSPDNSWEVATRLAKLDSRIRTHRMEQNGGKSVVMNHATNMARGEWIAILDSDDWYAPTRLEKLLAATETTPVEMVADNQVLIDSKASAYVGNAFAQGNDVYLDLDSFLEASDPTAPFDYGMLKPVFRASFIREKKVEYHVPARNGQDYYVLLSFFAAGGRALVLSEPLYFYIQPFGSISRRWAQQGRKRYNFELLLSVNNYFVEAYAQQFTQSQLRLLKWRGEGVRAMVHFHQIRESLRVGNVKKAVALAITAPSRLGTLILQRGGARLRRLVVQEKHNVRMKLVCPQVHEKPEGYIRASVVIPTYKAVDTIEKAVQSVLEQTERNIELIIVDDCSPDDNATWNVVTELAKRDSRIRTFRLDQNSGKAAAVNYGNQQAKGEWIALLDNDDWFHPDRIKRMVDTAEAYGVDMVADNQVLVDVPANAYAGSGFPKTGHDKVVDLDSFLESSDPTNNFDYGMMKPVFRAEFMRKHGVEYYPPARIGEDYYILFQYFVEGGKAVLLDKELYYYVQPFGSISRKWSREGRKPYNFRLMKQIHDHFADRYRNRLTSQQVKRLSVRGGRIMALAHFHDAREQFAACNWRALCNTLINAPFWFWPLVVQRGWNRIKGNWD